MTDTTFVPIQVERLDLADPVKPIDRRSGPDGTVYGRVRALILLHGIPLGVVWLDFEDHQVPPATTAAVVVESIGREMHAHLAADGIEPVTAADLVDGARGRCRLAGAAGSTELVTVVLATRGRPASLPAALGSVLNSDHPDFEVVVVDNSPTDARTRAYLDEHHGDDPRVRYVDEPRPGLSYARNRGLDAARGDIVAFTDDDVIVDRSWLSRLAAEYGDPQVGCVTGLVEPAELNALTQWWFEKSAGFGRGFERRAFRLETPPAESPLFPYKIGEYGTGASMSFRRSALPDGWTFDVALGAGSLTRSGEDIDLFLDVLMHDGTLVYQPAALSFHTHRTDYRGLHDQVVGYGRGLTALVLKRLITRPAERGLIARRVAGGMRHAFGPQFRPNSGDHVPEANPYPRSLVAREILGMAEGPLMYIGSRRRARQSAAS